MDYRQLVSVYREAGEDEYGEMLYDLVGEYHAYFEAIPYAKRFDVRGEEREGTVFIAIPDLVEIRAGDTLETDDAEVRALTVTVVRHPSTGKIIHTEVVAADVE